MRLKRGRMIAAFFFQALCVIAVKSAMPEYHFFHARFGCFSSDGFSPGQENCALSWNCCLSHAQRGLRIESAKATVSTFLRYCDSHVCHFLHEHKLMVNHNGCRYNHFAVSRSLSGPNPATTWTSCHESCSQSRTSMSSRKW